MKNILQEDLKLIEDLCSWNIDVNIFKEKTSFKANYEQLRELLYSVKNNFNDEGYNQYFEAIFWELPQNISEIEDEEVHKEFILMEFHNEHENMASAFQSTFNNNIENISVLLKALENIPEYLQPEDFKYPYVRKIIYAIGAQPQPDSLLALEKLAQETQDEKIKELALHQLEKRKRLGRWEVERNK